MLGNAASADDTDTADDRQARLRTRRWRVAFGAGIVLSLIVLFMPGDDVPAAPEGVDKVVHCVLFAVLAATGALAGVRRAALAGGLAAYAVTSEVLQTLPVLSRSGSAADALADAVGIAAGLWLAARALRRS